MLLSSRRRAALLLGVAALVIALRLPAQGPLKAVELKGIFDSAARVSHQIDSLNRRFAGTQQRAESLVADYRKHNEEPCEYPQGHPEMCDNYDRERQDLNYRSQELQKEMKAIDTPRRELRGRFAALMTRLRTADYAAELGGQKDQLVACSNANGVAESAACLARLQRRTSRTPPG